LHLERYFYLFTKEISTKKGLPIHSERPFLIYYNNDKYINTRVYPIAAGQQQQHIIDDAAFWKDLMEDAIEFFMAQRYEFVQ
jgi:hypothetical protein